MDFKAARLQMVKQQLRTWDILSKKVTKVMALIPRESFVPKGFERVAYADTNIPLSLNQSMLSPKVVGRMLEALSLKKEDRVLEIGTGTGYLTALLASLTKHVYSLESSADLMKKAQQNLEGANVVNVTLSHNNGLEGWALQGPYDVIVINGSLHQIPSVIKGQLALKGRLIGFVGDGPAMHACLYVNKLSKKELASGLNMTNNNNSHKNKHHTKILFETEVPRLPGAKEPSSFSF